MVIAIGLQRLQQIDLLPELQQTLQYMLEYDEDRVARDHPWRTIIPTVQRLLGGSEEAIAPFAAAWHFLYTATIRLDHLQDGDPANDLLPISMRLPAQYNLIFGYYILVSGILDLLSPDHIPIRRILRLRQLWTDMVLRMASGQQRDLITDGNEHFDSPLEIYQQLAQAKTGAMFALAFGGTAMLLTDDTQLINTLIAVGKIYGTLLQYSDDLRDAATQPNLTLTLPQALSLTQPLSKSTSTSHTPATFWSYVYHAYYAQVNQILSELPAAMQQSILALFARTFETA